MKIPKVSINVFTDIINAYYCLEIQSFEEEAEELIKRYPALSKGEENEEEIIEFSKEYYYMLVDNYDSTDVLMFYNEKDITGLIEN